MPSAVKLKEAEAFLNSIPDSEFRKVQSGIRMALVDGPGGLTLVREKYGSRMAIEAVVLTDVIDDIAHQMASQMDKSGH